MWSPHSIWISSKIESYKTRLLTILTSRYYKIIMLSISLISETLLNVRFIALMLLSSSHFLFSTVGNIIHVSEYGAFPNDGNDDTKAINAAVLATKPGDTVAFEAGVYDLVSSEGKAHVVIRSKKDITLQGVISGGEPATRLLRHVSMENREKLPQIISNRDNVNITIENFILDNYPRQTSAGVVVEKDPMGHWIRVRINDDLPMDEGMACKGANAWLPTTPPVLKNVRSLTYMKSPDLWKIYDQSERIMELHAGEKKLDFIELLDVGELITWHYGVLGQNMMENRESENVVLKNLRIPHIVNAFTNINYSRNILLKDIVFKSDNSCPSVGPRDAIHTSSNNGYLIFDNVDIEGVRQDPIVLRSRYAKISEYTDSTNFRIEALTGGRPIPENSTLGLWSSDGVLEYLKVQSAVYSSKPTRGYQISTQDPIPKWANVGTELKISAFMPDKVVIKNCDFTNNAAVDIICFTDNVTMTNNTHFKSMNAAIYLGSNFSSAGVCGDNIKILNSNFNDCGWEGKGISYGMISMNNNNKHQSAKITNLGIKNNTFENAETNAAIALDDVAGCIIEGNTFNNVLASITKSYSYVSNIQILENKGHHESLYINPSNFRAFASSNTEHREAACAIDQSGIVGNSHISNSPQKSMWLGKGRKVPKWFKVDLGKIYDLDHMIIYNLNWHKYTNRGCKNVQIFYTNSQVDPGNLVDNIERWNSIGDSFDLQQAPGHISYGSSHEVKPDKVDLSVSARWVAIKINSDYGGGFGGLSEIQFYE